MDGQKSDPSFPDRSGNWGQTWVPPPFLSRTLAAPRLSPRPGTFQRLFMRYFLSKIWDLRRRLQRLAFSARLLSQGWARHWAALIRALWGGELWKGRQCPPWEWDPGPASAHRHWLADSSSVWRRASPLLLDDKVRHKIFGLVRHSFEGLLIKIPVSGEHIVQGLCIVIAQEWGEATQPTGREAGGRERKMRAGEGWARSLGDSTVC